MAFRIDLDTCEAWLALTRFFCNGACLFNTSKNVWLNLLQESIFSFEKTNFNSSLKLWELKYL